MGILALLAWFSDRHQVELLKSREVAENIIVQQRMGRELEQAMADLQTLAQLPLIREWVETPSPRSEQRMVRACSAFSKWHKAYDHVRFIDTKGMERIRVNLMGDETVALPEEKLKYKGDRDFFTNAIKLGPGEVFISQLNLNAFRDPSEPAKPTIRFSTPVPNANGGKAGVLVINLIAENMLSWLKQDAEQGDRSATELLNAEGYWLHSIDPKNEWAFMAGKDLSYARSRPKEWGWIAARESGQFIGSEGLVTFHTIRMPVKDARSGQNFWKLVSNVTNQELRRFSFLHQRESWLVAASLLGLMGLVAAGLATATYRRRQAEEAMLLSRFTADHVADPLILIGPDGRIVDANQTASTILGYSREEFLGLGISDLDPFSTPEQWQARCRELEQSHSAVFESQKRTKDGRLLPVEVHSNLFRDKDRFFICDFVRDITERKRAEEALQHSETKFRTLFEHLAEGIALHELLQDETGKVVDYRILDVNPAFQTHTGIVAASALGRLGAEVYGTQAPPYLEEFSKVALGGEPYAFETFFPPLEKHFHISVVSPKRGQFATVFEDITERKRREEELRQKNLEMERFTYMVSHDLKSPLVTVRTFLGYLEQDLEQGKAERAAKDMGFIRDATGKMARLLEDLLEVSRVGRVVNPPVRVSLADLIKEALAAVAGAISIKGVAIQVEVPAITLFGDRPRLEELWQNLIENAVKYMGDQPAPRIELGVEGTGTESVFFVLDNGIGIDPRFQGKVFGLFEKLDPATEGTGLGLALVKRIVELHEGHIWLESEGQGRGSCFRFTLPKALKSRT